MNRNRKIIWLEISYSKLNGNCGIAEYEKTYQAILQKDYDLKCFYNPFYKNRHFKGILYFIWLNTYFYIKTLLYKPDAIIFSAFDMPYLIRKQTKYYVVFHDLILGKKEYSSPYMISKFQLLINVAIKNANKIITVSNTVKQQLLEKYSISQEKIGVVYNAIGENFKNNIGKTIPYKNIKPKKYIFSLAGSYPHKNIISLINAFDIINNKYPELQLIVSGYKGSLNLNSNNKNVIFTGFLTDTELASIYKNALIFVFPSLDEGFGRPAIEAQYANIPLICSDIPVFKEIAGLGAEFCEPTPQGIAEKVQYLLDNSDRLEELVKLGQENIKRFDFEKISEQLKNVIEI